MPPVSGREFMRPAHGFHRITNAYNLSSAATKIRPLTTIGVWKRRTKPIRSSCPPPANNTSPVKPLNACRRLSDSEPTAQTTGSELPSIVVTIGEPLPPLSAHQATSIVGGADAPIRNATRFPERPGQPVPVPLVSKVTKVPDAVL